MKYAKRGSAKEARQIAHKKRMYGKAHLIKGRFSALHSHIFKHMIQFDIVTDHISDFQ